MFVIVFSCLACLLSNMFCLIRKTWIKGFSTSNNVIALFSNLKVGSEMHGTIFS